MVTQMRNDVAKSATATGQRQLLATSSLPRPPPPLPPIRRRSQCCIISRRTLTGRGPSDVTVPSRPRGGTTYMLGFAHSEAVPSGCAAEPAAATATSAETGYASFRCISWLLYGNTEVQTGVHQGQLASFCPHRQLSVCGERLHAFFLNFEVNEQHTQPVRVPAPAISRPTRNQP